MATNNRKPITDFFVNDANQINDNDEDDDENDYDYGGAGGVCCDSNDRDDDNNERNIRIMSVSWEKGYLASCYYKLSTMELYATYEAADSSPEFPFLNNLFRYINPTYVVTSGPIYFLNAVIKNFGLKLNEINLDHFKINKYGKLPTTKLIIYPNDEKTVEKNYEKIIKIHLPGMQCNLTNEERRILIGSILPLQQTRVILCVGNLLHYIDNRWKHYALNVNNNNNGSIRITDLRIFFLQSQVLISNGTISSFQIFSNLYHPSGFVKGIKANTREGLSVYNILNKCQSRVGSKTLHRLLSQPIRNMNELNLSFSTINWYIKQQGNDSWIILKRHLKGIRDVSQTFRNIILKPNSIKNWKILKCIVYNAYLIMKFCQGVVINNSNLTVIEQLANTLAEEDKQLLQNILYTLNAVVDLEEGYNQNKFVVKKGFDEDLDEKKAKMISIQDELQETVRQQVEMSPELNSQNILGYYIPEVGYVIKMDITLNTPLIHNITNTNLSLLIQTDDAYYLTSSFCDDLNQRYSDIYPDICEHEARICTRLLEYLNENISAIQEVVKMCVKLDYMMSFAIVAIERCFVQPQIFDNKNHKIIEITQGRHILWEAKEMFVSNDAEISLNNQNLITILIAPNASGKSVYMKQIGIIAYLAHIGCFVPASSVKISLLDSIYSQMHTSESIYEATSSFLSDLQQMSHVMNTATGQSLVLIDEFGKGTTDTEGQALLVACIEELQKRKNNCPITIISTHYTDIAYLLKSKQNICIKTFEWENNDNGEIVPTFKLKTENDFNKIKSLVTIDRIKQSLNKVLQSENDISISSDDWKEIFLKKIGFGFEILQNYLRTQQIDAKQIYKDFNNLEL